MPPDSTLEQHDSATPPGPEEVIRTYLSSNGPTHADFIAACERWMAHDVVWIDRGNPKGVHGIAEIVAELGRVQEAGIEYMSFEILDLAVIGETVLTRRFDKLHGPDGTVLASLDMMGYNRVVNGKIVYGKEYHFDVADYDQTWGSADS